MANFTPRFNKAERAALERKVPAELERLARTAASDAYYAYLDGKNSRSKGIASQGVLLRSAINTSSGLMYIPFSPPPDPDWEAKVLGTVFAVVAFGPAVVGLLNCYFGWFK